jgi:hypothetical protein
MLVKTLCIKYIINIEVHLLIIVTYVVDLPNSRKMEHTKNYNELVTEGKLSVHRFCSS